MICLFQDHDVGTLVDELFSSYFLDELENAGLADQIERQFDFLSIVANLTAAREFSVIISRVIKWSEEFVFVSLMVTCDSEGAVGAMMCL